MNNNYDDIINLPHYVSKKRPQMSMEARSAQFAPFAALSGYDEQVKETARLTDKKIELEDGYITVTATTNTDKTQKNGKYIQRERFSGVCSRSYYAGENINEDDIKANFKNGTLIIRFPKNKPNKGITK